MGGVCVKGNVVLLRYGQLYGCGMLCSFKINYPSITLQLSKYFGVKTVRHLILKGSSADFSLRL